MNARTCDAQRYAEIDWCPSRLRIATITALIIARNVPELFAFTRKQNDRIEEREQSYQRATLELTLFGFSCCLAMRWSANRLFYSVPDGLVWQHQFAYAKPQSMRSTLRRNRPAECDSCVATKTNIWMNIEFTLLAKPIFEWILHSLCWRNNLEAEPSIWIVDRSHRAYAKIFFHHRWRIIRITFPIENRNISLRRYH